jgi:hypothetical protein
MNTSRRNRATFRPSVNEASLEDRLALSSGASGVAAQVGGVNNIHLVEPPGVISTQLSKLIGTGFIKYYGTAMVPPRH